MIGRGLKTQVDRKYLNGRVTIDKELFNGERYVYRVYKDGTYYILKGYQILLEHLKPGDEESRQRFISVLSAISEAYQEYFFSKIACLFNQHFAKPLEIDQEVDLTSDVNSLSYLYIEILFEYSGEPLNSMSNLSIDETYNLMRQSANALSLLHNTGLMHLDIKPSNMMYNSETNLLKMMDVGTSFGYGTHSIICRPTNTSKACIREFTREFAPPEIIKVKYGYDIPVSKLLSGNVDVYCWAMCFYTMMLEKSVATLIHEANFYKINGKEEYTKFMNATQLAMNKIRPRELKEQKKKEFMLEMVFEALSFNPQDRPNICEIQRRMKEFEKREKIEISYDKIEKDYEWKMLRMLMIGEDKKSRSPTDTSLTGSDNKGKSDDSIIAEKRECVNNQGDQKGKIIIDPFLHRIGKEGYSYYELHNQKKETVKTQYNSMLENQPKTNRSVKKDLQNMEKFESNFSFDINNSGGIDQKNIYESMTIMNDFKKKEHSDAYLKKYGAEASQKNNYNSMIAPNIKEDAIGSFYI